MIISLKLANAVISDEIGFEKWSARSMVFLEVYSKIDCRFDN